MDTKFQLLLLLLYMGLTLTLHMFLT